MKRAIEGLALESYPVPITSVHRQIKEYAEAIGETVPSYWTVYDIVREVQPSLRTLAHQGAKSYGESHMAGRSRTTRHQVAQGGWIEQLLSETLGEEKATDQKLTGISETVLALP
jgi:hypothetical protein